MILKQLKLTNFRNYSKIDQKFKGKVTVLVGDNAQGKSNFLESIFFLSTGKSPKAEADAELVKSDESVLRVEGELDNDTTLEIAMQLLDAEVDEFGEKKELLQKRVKVNGVARRLADYSTNLAAILFTPADINLVTGTPSNRRYHIDITLSQIDRGYKKAHSNYGDVVARRNRILKSIKEGTAHLDELDYWSNQMVELGEIIIKKRRAFFEFLENRPKNFGNFQFHYSPNEVTKSRLAQYQSRELGSATSLIGPHRDDFTFLLDERDLAKFGSRGEQRTAILDLKLAEVSFMESIINSRPILLLDDIFSELDEKHREYVIELSKLQQTIIATVEFEDFLKDHLKPAQFLKVEEGTIKTFA